MHIVIHQKRYVVFTQRVNHNIISVHFDSYDSVRCCIYPTVVGASERVLYDLQTLNSCNACSKAILQK